MAAQPPVPPVEPPGTPPAALLSPAARRTRAALHDLLVEHAAEAIVLFEPATRRLVEANPACLHLLGYAPDALPALTIDTVVAHPRVDLDAFVAQVLVRGTLQDDEWQWRHREGALVPVRMTAGALRQERRVFVFFIARDVREQRRAAAALRESEARYRAVVEQASDGIILFAAADGRIVETNLAMQRLLGYDAAELTGLTLYDLVAHDRAEVAANIARIVTAGRRTVGARRYRRRDGALVAVEVSASAISWGGQTTLCAVVRDVTARRRAEAALRAVVSHVPTALFALDAHGVFTLAAGRELAALGLTPEQVVGHSVFTLFAAVPRLLDGVRRALAGEDCTVTVALGEVVLEARHTPVRDDTGAVVEVLGVAADVTARVRAAAGLTPMEHKVLRLLAEDLTYKQIGAQLHISWQTVRKHVQGIADAFGVPAERVVVVRAARERGLL